MEAYKIFNYQRDVLIQQKMNDGTHYNPVKDVNGDYFIFKKEYKQCGLGESAKYIAPEPVEEF